MAKQLNLQGRVALVTGSGNGPGRAVALALGAAGAAVLAADVNPNRAAATAAEIVRHGGRAIGWAVDVGNKFQVSAMIEHLRDEFGGLHIVVNCWWVNRRQPFLLLDEYDWRRVIEVNLTGAFLVGQLAARVMTDEDGGAILMLGAPTAGGLTEQAPFVVSQVALASLADTMAAELGPQGVRAAYVAVHEDDDAATVSAVMRVLQAN